MLGPATGYDAFVFGSGDFQANNSQANGNLAAGGDVTLMNYAVAANIPGDSTQTPNPARLVVGGNLTATNGGVGLGQNGAIYVGGTTSLTGFTATGGIFAQNLVDFAAAQTLYDSLSATWADLTPNGTVTTGSTLTLTGTSPTLNVFSVAGSSIGTSLAINAPAGSTVLINVTGPSVTFMNGGVSLTGVSSADVMYNLVSATSLTLDNMNPDGSILAAFAATTAGTGALDGQLITMAYGGMNGNQFGETAFNDVLFQGTLPAVPLPGSAWLLAGGLLALAGLLRASRHAARLA